MSIIKKSDIYEDNILKPFNDAVDILTKKINTLTKSVSGLEKELREVQQTSDGKEAKNLVKTTQKLNTETTKLKTVQTARVKVQNQINNANIKLTQSRTKEAKQLALLKVRQQEHNKQLREAARQQLGLGKSTNGLVKSFKTMGVQMLTSLGLLGGLVGAFKLVKDTIAATAEGQIFLAKVTGAAKAVFAQLRDIIIDASSELIEWIKLLNTDASAAAKSFGELLKENLVSRFEGLKVAIFDAGKELDKGNFKGALSKITDGVIQMATGTENATEKTKELLLQLKIMADFGAAIAGSEKKLALERSRFAIQQAKNQRKINELREKAEQKELFTAQQRQDFIKEAIRLQEINGNQNAAFARKELALQQAVFNANKSNIDEEIELNKLRSKSDEIKAQSTKRLIALRSKEQSILNEQTKLAKENAQLEIEFTKEKEDAQIESIETLKHEEINAINELSEARDTEAKKEQQRTLEQRKRQEEQIAIVQAAALQAGETLGELFAKGELTFKEFGKFILVTTLDLIEKQLLVYFAAILAREIASKSFAGIATAAILIGLVKGSLGAAKNAVQNFAEGTESVQGPGTETSDSVPAMLSINERVVPAHINKQLPNVPNEALPGLIWGSNLASLEKNTALTNMLLSNGLGMVYTEDGFLIKKLATGKTIKKRL